MRDWFTIDQMAEDTYIISEYRHWEENHCYLLNGTERSLLIDTGLGICNIYDEVVKLTDRPVMAAATHIHWDHIGGHKYFPDFYAHREEMGWLNGEFPLTIETIRQMVADRCDLPEGYEVNTYDFFQGIPAGTLEDGDEIDIGGRIIRILHTPGHLPGHMCFGRGREVGCLPVISYIRTRCSPIIRLPIRRLICILWRKLPHFRSGGCFRPITPLILSRRYSAVCGKRSDS